MKTYQECEQEFDERVERMSSAYKNNSPDRLAFQFGIARSVAVQLAYEIEVMNDQSNTREMHALYERLGGK